MLSFQAVEHESPTQNVRHENSADDQATEEDRQAASAAAVFQAAVTKLLHGWVFVTAQPGAS